MTTTTRSPLDKELHPPAHLAQVLATVGQLYNDQVAPREQALEARLADEREFLDADGKLHPEIIAARREIMRAAGKAGVYSAHLPKRLGGGDLGRTDMIYVEEKVYGYGCGLNPALLSWSEGATPRLLYCHDHQREQFVAPLVRGEKTSLHGVTETGAGSNLFDMKTHAKRRGGDWVLSGAKAYITNAFDADVAQVLAITEPGGGRRTFTYFMFDTREYLKKGYRTGRVYQTMFGDGYTGEIFFDDMVLPESAVIGEVGQGFDIAVMSFNYTRMRRAGMCSGWSKYLIERSLERVQSRIVGDRPLGANQGIQWMIADMYVDWLQTRSLSLEVARTIDNPGPWYQLPRPKDEIRRICALKVSNDESFYRVADRALQVHGGFGVMRNNPINKLFQIARNLRIPGGTDEVQRTTIAETLGLRFEASKSAPKPAA
ncbi:MAG TPA: acyl-CoA dehydrogenase family protein [Steroidobacteraceae bacterium]|nr:acyl-CoA dehydrogenase family protein [Steroidobacteraceae bacterium]HRX88266.1 acyl-CoA dehydrogenase family protein [Steroidobacteraceae bacterium]